MELSGERRKSLLVLLTSTMEHTITVLCCCRIPLIFSRWLSGDRWCTGSIVGQIALSQLKQGPRNSTVSGNSEFLVSQERLEGPEKPREHWHKFSLTKRRQLGLPEDGQSLRVQSRSQAWSEPSRQAGKNQCKVSYPTKTIWRGVGVRPGRWLFRLDAGVSGW